MGTRSEKAALTEGFFDERHDLELHEDRGGENLEKLIDFVFRSELAAGAATGKPTQSVFQHGLLAVRESNFEVADFHEPKEKELSASEREAWCEYKLEKLDEDPDEKPTIDQFMYHRLKEKAMKIAENSERSSKQKLFWPVVKAMKVR